MRPTEIKTYRFLDVVVLKPGKRREKVGEGEFLAFSSGINSTGLSKHSNCPAETIRLTRKGTVGNTYWHEEPFWMEEKAYAVEPKAMLNKRYLFHWLLMKQAELSSCRTEGQIPGFDLSRLSKLTIEVPDLDYQEATVNILEQLTDNNTWWLATITKEIQLYQSVSDAIRGIAMDLLNDKEE